MTTAPIVRFVVAGAESDCIGPGRRYTLVFDGQCGVCNRVVRLLERWDRRRQIEIVPSQNKCMPARFPWIPRESFEDAMQLIGPGGRTTQGAQAIEELLRILPLGWAIGWVFKLPLVGWLADRFYRWFARNRYKFGCDDHCQLRPERLDYGGAEPVTSSRPGAPTRR